MEFTKFCSNPSTLLGSNIWVLSKIAPFLDYVLCFLFWVFLSFFSRLFILALWLEEAQSPGLEMV